MADRMRPEARPRVMSKVRRRAIRPEMYVRKALWRKGFRYRLHVRKLPGRPDITLRRYKTAIFVPFKVAFGICAPAPTQDTRHPISNTGNLSCAATRVGMQRIRLC